MTNWDMLPLPAVSGTASKDPASAAAAAIGSMQAEATTARLAASAIDNRWGTGHAGQPAAWQDPAGKALPSRPPSLSTHRQATKVLVVVLSNLPRGTGYGIFAGCEVLPGPLLQVAVQGRCQTHLPQTATGKTSKLGTSTMSSGCGGAASLTL